ncbi:protein FATTY ACID EXPORT 6-like [Hordeum vulgare]|nr:protein FATTY ACID EXPORT 6-like [Hordeum vulgare]
MDDFYVTIPYGLVVLGGGVAGYVKRGSVASLAAGAGFGGALLLAGALSIWAFTGGHSSSLFATVLQTGEVHFGGSAEARSSNDKKINLEHGAEASCMSGKKLTSDYNVYTIDLNRKMHFKSAVVLIFYVYKISKGGNEVYLPVSAE